MSKMNFKNAREKEQLKRMRMLSKNKSCHFCGKSFLETHSSPVIFKNKNWFITANDFPYKGTRHHYLIVSKKHITNLKKVKGVMQKDLFESVTWLEKFLKVKGYSLFVRSGDMSLTGATIDHLHFHFIVGQKRKKNSEWLLVTLGFTN